MSLATHTPNPWPPLFLRVPGLVTCLAEKSHVAYQFDPQALVVQVVEMERASGDVAIFTSRATGFYQEHPTDWRPLLREVNRKLNEYVATRDLCDFPEWGANQIAQIARKESHV